MSPLDIDREELDLVQLAKAAGVTPRTVRYYVQQGLLPSPGTRGPGTKYDRALLDRLLLIKGLQRQHLPLSEIRRRLESLDDEGVRAALGADPELPLRDTALGYVRAVMDRVKQPGESLPVRVASPPPPAFSAGEQDLFGSVSGPKYPTKGTWERMSLSRDVELHVRRPLSREQNKRVDRLLQAAREIFSEEP